MAERDFSGKFTTSPLGAGVWVADVSPDLGSIGPNKLTLPDTNSLTPAQEDETWKNISLIAGGLQRHFLPEEITEIPQNPTGQNSPAH
jgi:hypothetical protein